VNTLNLIQMEWQARSQGFESADLPKSKLSEPQGSAAEVVSGSRNGRRKGCA